MVLSTCLMFYLFMFMKLEAGGMMQDDIVFSYFLLLISYFVLL